jgi:hypothetical protein
LSTARSCHTRRSFRNDNSDFFVQMFKTFVRPLLEYGTCVWSPYLNVDINLIEQVQRKFTKYLPGCFDMSYSDRLKKHDLLPLCDRRLINDFTMLFKIVHRYIELSLHDLELSFCASGRGHKYKLNVLGSTKDVRRHCFNCRIVFIWNKLDSATVSSPSIRVFKQRLMLDPNFYDSLSEDGCDFLAIDLI